jgi:UPF0755 protein
VSFSAPELDDDDGYSEPWSPRETFRVRRRHRRWMPWLLGILIVALLVAGVSVVWVRHQINPGRPGAPVAVTIPPGSSGATIASILGKAGVIHDPTVFRFYLKAEGAGALLPGQYTLPRNSSYGSVVTALEKGPPILYQKFTIPEGFTLAQIAARVGALPGRTVAGFMAAATSGEVRSQYEPAGVTNLEGLLFPSTYSVKADASDLSIVQMMVTTFDQTAATLAIDQAATTLGMTPYQIVIVASMVEREAKLDEDRGPIASVIYNRLRMHMLLQIDATVLYGEGTTDPSQFDASSDSPYNTYKFKGLPPTPIACPGIPSLMAAATPPTTDYLYYRTIEPNGKTGFAATAAGFAQLQAEAKANGLP